MKEFSLTPAGCSMTPIAYDRTSYNVQFYRDPTHGSEAYRRQYTESIIKVIDIVEAKAHNDQIRLVFQHLAIQPFEGCISGAAADAGIDNVNGDKIAHRLIWLATMR